MWVVGILRHSSKVQKHMYKVLIEILRSWIIRPKFEMIGGVNNDYSWQNISKCHKTEMKDLFQKLIQESVTGRIFDYERFHFIIMI